MLNSYGNYVQNTFYTFSCTQYNSIATQKQAIFSWEVGLLGWSGHIHHHPLAESGNVGQKGELDSLEERAKASGASKLYVEDLTDEFVDNYVMEPLLPLPRGYCHLCRGRRL